MKATRGHEAESEAGCGLREWIQRQGERSWQYVVRLIAGGVGTLRPADALECVEILFSGTKKERK